MTISDLNAIAMYHSRASHDALAAAELMGDCPAARSFEEKANLHAEWYSKLSNLAHAFETLRPLIGEE